MVGDLVAHEHGVHVGALGQEVVVAHGVGLAIHLGLRQVGLHPFDQHLARGAHGHRGAQLHGLGLVRAVVGLGLAIAHKGLHHAEVVGAQQHPVLLGGAQVAACAGVADLVAFIETGQRQRAAKVEEIGTHVLLAVVAGLLAKLVLQVGLEAADVGCAVHQLVAPARVRRRGGAPACAVEQRHVHVQDQGREGERVAQRVAHHGRQEVGGHPAAQHHRAKAAREADVGVAREEGVVGEAALAASVHLDERGQLEVGLEAAAQVFGALEAKPGCSEATAVDHRLAACIARVFDGAGKHIDQTGHFNRALGMGAASAQQHAAQRKGQCQQVFFHGFSWVGKGCKQSQK